jgi:hypothetical protein
MTLQEQISRMKSMMGVITEGDKRISTIQRLIDIEIEDLKDICEKMESESEEIISFDVCNYLNVLNSISVTNVSKSENRFVVQLLIKYESIFEYVDNEAFVYELSYRLKKLISNLKFEVETINTKTRDW